MTQSRLFRLAKDYLDTNCQIKLILSQNWTQNVMMFDVEGFDIVTEVKNGHMMFRKDHMKSQTVLESL